MEEVTNHYLVVGEVTFITNPQTEDETIGRETVNSVFLTDVDGKLNAAALGRMQNSLVNQFIHSLGDQASNVRVLNSTLTGFFFLGSMTKTEFFENVEVEVEDEQVHEQ